MRKVVNVAFFIIFMIIGQKFPIIFHFQSLPEWNGGGLDEFLLWLLNFEAFKYNLIVSFICLALCMFFIFKMRKYFIIPTGFFCGWYYFVILYPLNKHEIVSDIFISESSSLLTGYAVYGILLIGVPILFTFLMYKMSLKF